MEPVTDHLNTEPATDHLNTEAVTSAGRMEIWHHDYNLDKKDNLATVPAIPAVFGIFAIVHGQPVNCRFIGSSDNLQAAVKELFENPPGANLKKFMQGPWIQLLVYEPMPGADAAVRQKAEEDWTTRHQPAIDENGGYPGYYSNGKKDL
jgi:hypothetical protein